MLDRRFAGNFLYAPFLALRMARRVEVDGVQFVNQIVVAFIRCRLRFISGLLLSSRRTDRSLCVVQRMRNVIPKVAFIRSQAQFGILSLGQVRQEVRFSIQRGEAGYTRFLTVVVLMSREPLMRRVNVLFLSRTLYRHVRDVVNGMVFRDVQCKIVRLFRRECVTFTRMVVIIQARRIFLSEGDDQLTRDLVNDFRVGIARALRPNVRGRQRAKIAFRHRNFASMRLPFEWPPVLFMRVSRNACRIGLAFKVRRDRRLVRITVNVPREVCNMAVIFDHLHFSNFRN